MTSFLTKLFGRKPAPISDYQTRRRLAVSDFARMWRTYVDGLPHAARAMPHVLTGFVPQCARLIATQYRDLGELSALPGNQVMLPRMLHDAIAETRTHDVQALEIAWSALDLPGKYSPPRSTPSIDDYLRGKIDPPA